MSDIQRPSLRQIEQLKLATEKAEHKLEDVDIELAKVVDEAWFMAGLCREYFDALYDRFKDDNGECLLDTDRILKIMSDTIGMIRR